MKKNSTRKDRDLDKISTASEGATWGVLSCLNVVLIGLSLPSIGIVVFFNL